MFMFHLKLKEKSFKRSSSHSSALVLYDSAIQDFVNVLEANIHRQTHEVCAVDFAGNNGDIYSVSVSVQLLRRIYYLYSYIYKYILFIFYII